MDYPELRQLFGAYLNRDWPEAYGTIEAAIQAFCTQNGIAIVAGAHAEGTELLARPATGLAERLDDFGLEYDIADDAQARAFLQTTVAHVAKALGNAGANA